SAARSYSSPYLSYGFQQETSACVCVSIAIRLSMSMALRRLEGGLIQVHRQVRDAPAALAFRLAEQFGKRLAQPRVTRIGMKPLVPVLLHAIDRKSDRRIEYLDRLLQREGLAEQARDDHQQFGLRDDACHAEETRKRQHHASIDTFFREHLVDDR